MKVLLVGDAGVATGFARCTHALADALQEGGHEPVVLGVNYDGDPTPEPYPYPIYPAKRAMRPDYDGIGISRLPQLMYEHRPDAVVIITDPWYLPDYMQAARTPEIVAHVGEVPVIGWLALDGKNCQLRWLDGKVIGKDPNPITAAVWWTDFAESEARRCGWNGPSHIVPLGVDTDLFRPRDRDEAYQRVGFPAAWRDGFVVGMVGRNQLRKRIDLALSYFAEWIERDGIDDAYLYLHVAPTGEMAVDLKQLVRYMGLSGRAACSRPEVKVGEGMPEDLMPLTYASFDVLINTSQGEGWGLCVSEAMACGVPCIVPECAALGDWPGEAAFTVPCTDIAVTPGNINVVGAVPDRESFIDALGMFYRRPEMREDYARRGFELMQQPRFRWESIGAEMVKIVQQYVGTPVREAVPA